MEVVDYVNPNIGTVGHLLTATAPVVSLPHGMAQVAPITTPGITDRYFADKIFGFPAGCAGIMATAGKCETGAKACASGFDHDLETAAPHHYSVVLEDYEILAEYSVTRHCVYFRFTFPASPLSRVLVRMPAEAELDIAGDRCLAGSAVASGVRQYVRMEFSTPFVSAERWYGNDDSGCAFHFATFGQDHIDVKIGISYIGPEQARRNLEREIAGWDFDKVKSDARGVWNEALGRIAVEGGTEEQKTVFYTALYRSLLYMSNITEDGRYYSGFDRQTHEADGHDFYTVDNMWDSYRCLHPLQLLIEPRRQVDMIESYIRMFEQSGWLAQFPGLGGDRPYMTGNHTAAMITDTYLKGYRDFDADKAYEAMRKNAMEATMLPWTDNGPLTELERVYLDKGFFPALGKGETEWVKEVHGFEKRQAVSLTLEHAYDDWCIAQMAEALGRDEDYDYFMKRASNYKNVFDGRIGFMAPKTADGNWVEPFDPKLSGGQGGRDYFSECNSWIYTFHVQHDVKGLIELLGGNEKFEEKLDSLFVEQYGGSKYEFLSQFPDATGLIGQYCQGNEPAFHIPYLYNYAGAPWKTQRKVREIMKLWFNAGPLGICGDEDAGAMSSWYVFSAMGLYPVCPGKPWYDIGSPIFDEVRIRLEDGNTFTVRAVDVSEKNKYIQSAVLNGQPLNRPWIGHKDIIGGGMLELQMGLRPNKQWGGSKLNQSNHKGVTAMESQTYIGLSEQEVKQYWEDGYLIFHDIISAEEVEELRLACEQPQILALRTQKDYETKTVHALGITSLHPLFLKLAKHPAIMEKIKPLLGNDIQLQHSKLATKPPAKGVGLFHWHQDYAFYPHTNTDLLSVMVMLDDATPENGCMKMVKGSHRFGILNHEKDGRFVQACQETHYWENPQAPHEVVNITPKTGGISIHHALTLHGSDANLSGKPRRGIVFSYRACDSYQLADALFDDTGLLICGSNKGVVRCDAGVVNLPNRGGDMPFGSTWNQIGTFAAAHNKQS